MIENNFKSKIRYADSMEIYFTAGRLESIRNASTFEELGRIALEMLKEFALNAHSAKPIRKVAMVLGPVKTGGLGSFDENIKRFNFTIKVIEDEGDYVVFNQAAQPLQEAIERIFAGGYDAEELINGFNRPLLESGEIDKIFLLPNEANLKGETSKGTNIESEIIKKQKIMTLPVTEKWFDDRKKEEVKPS